MKRHFALQPANYLWPGFGLGTGAEQRQADLFFRDLVGGATRPRIDVGSEAEQAAGTQPQPGSACPLPKRSAIAYFFKAADYVRYNIASNLVDVGPTPVSRFWKLPSEFQSNLDAALNWGDGHVYFFRRARYLRYNLATDKVDVAAIEIATNWTRLPSEFQSNLNATVNWGDGFAYFFKGPRCLRYDIANDRPDGEAKAIVEVWPTLGQPVPEQVPFRSNLDSVVTWGDGNAYFFKGNGYIRINMATNLIDVGPVAISRYWPQLPPLFQSGIKAAVQWTDPCDLAALLRTAGLTVTEQDGWRTRVSEGEASCFTPIGIIIHHTGHDRGTAANVLADIVTNVKANFFVDKSGAVTVVSGGRANHAGMGSQQVLDEVNRSVAPTATATSRRLRRDRIGNGHFYGFENYNRGDGADPWPEVQVDAIARAAAALCQRHGWNANRVIGHKEWSTGKPVCPTLDMDQFRARVASHF